VTEIAFHFGAPDKLGYAARLLRKVSTAGAKAVVVAENAVLAQLDVALWGVGQTDFVPHAVAGAAPAVLKRSTIFFKNLALGNHPECTVLVNLSDQLPDNFNRFERVIEVVSTDVDDRARARERWKTYTRSGYSITRHDLNLRAPHN
jgi:DNA polymerase-3 subunit chi